MPDTEIYVDSDDEPTVAFYFDCRQMKAVCTGHSILLDRKPDHSEAQIDGVGVFLNGNLVRLITETYPAAVDELRSAGYRVE